MESRFIAPKSKKLQTKIYENDEYFINFGQFFFQRVFKYPLITIN